MNINVTFSTLMNTLIGNISGTAWTGPKANTVLDDSNMLSGFIKSVEIQVKNEL